MTLTDSTPVIVLWWITLVLTVVAIVPVALLLLHRAYRAARMIRIYTDETVEAARGVARNARAIAALDQTIEGAGPIAEKAERLDAATARLAAVLGQRTG